MLSRLQLNMTTLQHIRMIFKHYDPKKRQVVEDLTKIKKYLTKIEFLEFSRVNNSSLVVTIENK